MLNACADGKKSPQSCVLCRGIPWIWFFKYLILPLFFQVRAEDSKHQRLSQETAMLIKEENECNQHLHVVIGKSTFWFKFLSQGGRIVNK